MNDVNPAPVRAMIVDDGPEDMVVLSHLLEKAGLPGTPQQATRGDGALAYLREAQSGTPLLTLPSVLFIDAFLPAFTGFDLVQWIRCQPPLHSIVTILLSASDEPRNLGKALQVGADGYIVKFPPPSAMRELLVQVEKQALLPWPRPVLPITCNLLVTRAA